MERSWNAWPTSEMAPSYGDVTGEYLALRREAGLVEHHHDLVWARGGDGVRFLQDLITQEVADLPPGSVARSLLLSPRGKLRASFWVLRGSDEVALVVEAGFAEVVVSDLERFKIRVDVRFEIDPRPVLEVWGPRAGSILDTAGLPVPDGWTEGEGAIVADCPLGGLERLFVVGVGRDRLLDAGAAPVGELAATAVRVEAGEPRTGKDLEEGTIPQEAGLERDAISFGKGCYLGQELVARIDTRGHVNRLLRGVVLETNVLPPERCELWARGGVVGRLTSVSESLTFRAPIGLALIRRDIEPGVAVEARWQVGNATGRVHDLPLDDFTGSMT